MLEHAFDWMPENAPYMPVASVGLLAVLEPHDPRATMRWLADEDPMRTPRLVLATELTLDDIAAAIADAPWPDVEALSWEGKLGQAIKPMLKAADDPVAEWRRLAGLDGSQADEPDVAAAQRLVAALLTDGSVDADGVPNRNRLLRGVKADLSGVRRPPKVTAEALLAELTSGPAWRSGSSGMGLGLVPEVQTFGGAVGPNPSSVGAYSPLLYRLCWHGVTAMPPFGVLRGTSRAVGGPLFVSAGTLSWPVWTIPARRTALVAILGLAVVQDPEPDVMALRARGIDAVFRSQARPINTMIAVFGWGSRVA